MTWADLSDDELEDRLARRVQGWRARELVARRDEPGADAVIDAILEDP